MGQYTNMIELRGEYRRDYGTNRIIHQVDYEVGVIKYKKGAARKIGFRKE